MKARVRSDPNGIGFMVPERMKHESLCQCLRAQAADIKLLQDQLRDARQEIARLVTRATPAPQVKPKSKAATYTPSTRPAGYHPVDDPFGPESLRRHG